MEDLSKRCFLCMRKKDEANQCPHCGAAELSQDPGLLPLGTILAGRYYVGKVKKQNNEGATYIAFDLRESRRCSVREFFPAPIARREADALSVVPLTGQEEVFSACLDDFRTLWAKLMRLRGLTALISVIDQFTENGTAYAAYEETEELTLRDHLLGNGVGYIPWEQARILFMPVLSTLATLHTSGVLHRGLNPEAFLVTESGKLKLTDFSIADVRVCYGELDAEIAEGYAPIEIYAQKYGVGPWTDIYAFTAVLYRALIGTKPIPAPTRLQNDQMMIPAKFAEELPPYVINAIINGMQIEPEQRTRNVEQLRSNLSASPRAVSASAGAYRETERAAAQRGGSLRDDAYAAGARRSMYDAGAQRPGSSLADLPAEPKAGAAGAARPPRAAQPEQPQRREQDTERMIEEQLRREKKRKILLILLGVLLVLAVVGLAILVSGAVGGKKPANPETTAVSETPETVRTPNFVGAMYDAVMADSLYSSYFHLIKVEEYNATAAKGTILSQSVLPETIVNRGTEIILYVSAGPRTFELPDVSGMTYEEAVATLSPMGLICERATKYNDGTREPDKVAETLPIAGKQVTQGDRVTVILWASLEPETTLPSVTLAPSTTASVTTGPVVTVQPPTVTQYQGESGTRQDSGLSGILSGLFG